MLESNADKESFNCAVSKLVLCYVSPLNILALLFNFPSSLFTALNVFIT